MYRAALVAAVWEEPHKNSKDIKQLLSKCHNHLKKYIPFWQETDFFDVQQQFMRYDAKFIKNADEHYIRLRERFLVAKLTDSQESDDNLLSELHRINGHGDVSADVLTKAMQDPTKVKLRIAEKEKCSFCSEAAICLQRYWED